VAGFQKVSFDVANQKRAMAVRHRASQTYLKYSAEYRLAESAKKWLPLANSKLETISNGKK